MTFSVIALFPPALAFDNASFEHAYASRAASGNPAVTVQIRASDQGAFNMWTLDNVGRRMAIVLDGRVRQALLIHAPLHNSVMITLESATRAVMRKRAMELALVLGTESLLVVPRLVKEEQK